MRRPTRPLGREKQLSIGEWSLAVSGDVTSAKQTADTRTASMSNDDVPIERRSMAAVSRRDNLGMLPKYRLDGRLRHAILEAHLPEET